MQQMRRLHKPPSTSRRLLSCRRSCFLAAKEQLAADAQAAQVAQHKQQVAELQKQLQEERSKRGERSGGQPIVVESGSQSFGSSVVALLPFLLVIVAVAAMLFGR